MNITELCVNCKQNNSCTMCWKTSNKKCPHFIQKTNADRIRAMSDEELADAWMKDVVVCHRCAYAEECECDEYVTIEKCREGLLEWLKQPAED